MPSSSAPSISRRRPNRIVTDAMHFPSILYLLDQETRRRSRGRGRPLRGRGRGGHPATRRRDRRPHGDREPLARPVQVGVRPRRRGDHREGAAGPGDQHHRRLPGRRHDPGGCAGPGDRRLHRRLPEMALRRPGCGVPLGRSGRRPHGSSPGSPAGWPTSSRSPSSRKLVRRDDAWRFLHGTPSIPALYAARPGLEIVREAGIDGHPREVDPTDAAPAGPGRPAGYRCTTPRDPVRRGGTVAIDVENGYEVSQSLKSLDILCDYRPAPASASRRTSTTATTSSTRRSRPSARSWRPEPGGLHRRPDDGDLIADVPEQVEPAHAAACDPGELIAGRRVCSMGSPAQGGARRCCWPRGASAQPFREVTDHVPIERHFVADRRWS